MLIKQICFYFSLIIHYGLGSISSDLSSTCDSIDKPCKGHPNTKCDENTGECRCQDGFVFKDPTVGCVSTVPEGFSSCCYHISTN